MSHLLSEYATDETIARSALATLPIPPSQGRYHNPISFDSFITQVEHSMHSHGLQITNEEHLISHGGQRYFGMLELEPAISGEYIPADEWNLFLGLRGSHDQSIPRGLALGRQVMVCSNLCFSGDIATLSTKQTTNIWSRLPELVDSAISQVPALAHKELERVDRLQHFELKPRWGDAALVEIHRRGGLSSAQLARAISEWDNPTFPAHAANGHTAWRLEQATTQATKPTSGRSANLFTVQSRTRTASAFINEIIGF